MNLKPGFAAFLQNNDVPAEFTILEVTESLNASLHELQKVDAEIQQLLELMETVEMRRQRIREVISDHKVILSPVRRLPPDVLHEIFFHCLPTDRNPVMKHSESPLLLTRICHSWRAIALSSPRIWSKVHVPLPGDHTFSEWSYALDYHTVIKDGHRQSFADVVRSRCDAIRRWLSRSGACPLSLSIGHSGDYSSLGIELIQEMFDMLLSFADRWRDIDLSIPEDIYNDLLDGINPATFCSLKSLKIALSSQEFADWEAEPIPIRLLAAPSLRRVTISARQTSRLTGNLAQPIWHRITHLTFTSSTTDKYLLVLLRQCPNLVFGEFMTSFSRWADQTVDKEEAFLPRLETLAINDFGAREIMTIVFNAIKAPALTRLLYQWFNPPLNSNSSLFLPTPVIPLLENSALISDLSLSGELSSQHTRECLQRGERVTRVVFGGPPSTNVSGHQVSHSPFMDPDVVIRPDTFDLRILSIGSGAVTLLPRLEYLEAYHLSRLTDEALLDIITSRINGFKRGETAALKSLKLSFKRKRQKDITEDVSRLAKEAGIEVKLDLTYLMEGCKFVEHTPQPLLTSGFSPNNDMWY
ncbi:hypothetical protein M413DRAFT_445486 [Hebeloma cylindrosporum]|uniref:F-box domain-containing protein n=1 Tax=Hebeloma cylindrosporum TaxID=76867 RepID=A0A0C2XV05_HEBCY|nr:hypothetical protein M413DRAFT_445486 [Hebeloma cylindrosporum h7]